MLLDAAIYGLPRGSAIQSKCFQIIGNLTLIFKPTRTLLMAQEGGSLMTTSLEFYFQTLLLNSY
jgi:hypothetical protein